MRECMRVRRSVSAFDKRYRNIANGKELRSKWKTDIRTDLCESCRAWTRVCNGTGTEFGASSWTELHAQVHNSFDNWLRTLYTVNRYYSTITSREQRSEVARGGMLEALMSIAHESQG